MAPRSSPTQKISCPRCGSTRLIRSVTGELYCADCGFVLEETVMVTIPWPRKSKTRSDWLNPMHPAEGTEHVPGRLHQASVRASSREPRRIAEVVRWIRAIDRALNIGPGAVALATEIAKRLLPKGGKAPYPCRDIAIVATFAACRQLGIPRDVGEMALVVNSPRRISKLIRWAREKGVEIPPANREAWVRRIAAELGIRGRPLMEALALVSDYSGVASAPALAIAALSVTAGLDPRAASQKVKLPPQMKYYLYKVYNELLSRTRMQGRGKGADRGEGAGPGVELRSLENPPKEPQEGGGHHSGGPETVLRKPGVVVTRP